MAHRQRQQTGQASAIENVHTQSERNIASGNIFGGYSETFSNPAFAFGTSRPFCTTQLGNKLTNWRNNSSK
jgi:hypothetical protein